MCVFRMNSSEEIWAVIEGSDVFADVVSCEVEREFELVTPRRHQSSNQKSEIRNQCLESGAKRSHRRA